MLVLRSPLKRTESRFNGEPTSVGFVFIAWTFKSVRGRGFTKYHIVNHFTPDGNVARPAFVILPSAIILLARSLFVSVQFDLGLRRVKRVA